MNFGVRQRHTIKDKTSNNPRKYFLLKNSALVEVFRQLLGEELYLLTLVVSVVEEQLFTFIDVSIGEYADLVVAIHNNHFCAAIWVA